MPQKAINKNALHYLKILALSLFSLLIIVFIAIFYLLKTESGSRWALGHGLNFINKDPTIAIAIESISGTLYAGLNLSNVHISLQSSTANTLVKLEEFSFRWTPLELLNQQVFVDNVSSKGLQLSLESYDNTPEASPTTPIESIEALFSLPISFNIKHAQIDNAELTINQENILIQHFETEFYLYPDRLNLLNTQLLSPDFQVNSNIELFSENLAIAATLAWEIDGSISNLPMLATEQLQGELNLTGDLNTLSIEHHFLRPFSINSSGSIETGFSNQAQLKFALQHILTDINLPVNEQAQLYNLNGEFKTNGSPTSIELNANLTALLNNYPLSVSGRVNLIDSRLNAIDIDIQSDSNALMVNGSIADSLNLQWNISALELEKIYPGLTGSINGSGSVNGSLDAPEIIADLQASGLAYSQGESTYKINNINLSASSQHNINTISADISGIDIPLGKTQNNAQLQEPENNAIFSIEKIQLQLLGSAQQHEIEIDIDVQSYHFNLQNNGSYSLDRWNSSINTASLDSAYGQLTLSDTIDLQISQTAASFSQHCWQFYQTSLCSAGNWSKNIGLNAIAALHNIPLAYLNSPDTLANLENVSLKDKFDKLPTALVNLLKQQNIVLPERSFIDGNLSTELTFNGLGSDDNNSFIKVNLLPENIYFGFLSPQPTTQSDTTTQQLSSETTFEIKNTDVNILFEKNVWQAITKLELYRQESSVSNSIGIVSSQIKFDDLDNIDGFIEFEFSDIVWIKPLVPSINLGEVSGRINTSILISGNITQPLFLIDAKLDSLELELPDYGINLFDSELELHSDTSNQVNLSGTIFSGEGQLDLVSTIMDPMLTTRSIVLQIYGENFQVINLPTTQVAFNPEIDISFSNQKLVTQGSINITQLNVDLSEAPIASSGVSISRDAVIIAAPAEKQELLTKNTLAENFSSTANVRITLPDDSRFKGYGLELSLGGELQVEQDHDRPILAYGEVLINEGSYEIYRQHLNIDSGKLLFLGNPQNPALDIRAFRDVKETTVGVQINGTINNMQSQLFSTPTLPENEVLAMLITGKSFNKINSEDENGLINAIANLGIKQGQGLTNKVRSQLGLDTLTLSGGSNYKESSLGLGKFITPDLFLHYGVGLFNNKTNLGLKYSLSDSIKLEVESGISQSIDLTYTIEK